jgi:hypothetical protein
MHEKVHNNNIRTLNPVGKLEKSLKENSKKPGPTGKVTCDLHSNKTGTPM